MLVVYSINFLEKRGIDDAFGPQLIGILAIGAWAYGTSFLVFKVIDSTVGLRVTAEEEIAGLDASEHGTSAYGDFITKD